MHILVIGQSGQLAQKLRQAAERTDDVTVTLAGRSQFDLAASVDLAGKLESWLDAHDETGAVINTAGYTAVDLAESQRERSFTINGEAPGILAGVCAQRALPLLHISTDYVFDGRSDTAYTETDPTGPLNVYGASKLAGEDAIRANHAHHIIFRTSWLFSEKPNNFLTTMARLARSRRQLEVVADEVGRPTPADSFAETLLLACQRAAGNEIPWGLYHYAGDTEMSWADFARRIMARLNPDIDVKSLSSREYGAAAERPAYSALDTRKFEQTFDQPSPSFDAGLDRAVALWRESR